jgi:hypothetical protein
MYYIGTTKSRLPDSALIGGILGSGTISFLKKRDCSAFQNPAYLGAES